MELNVKKNVFADVIPIPLNVPGNTCTHIRGVAAIFFIVLYIYIFVSVYILYSSFFFFFFF